MTLEDGAVRSHTMLFSEAEAVSGSWATTSMDNVYRYTLGRTLKRGIGHGYERRRVLFVMLNPSTADMMRDDPTIRKCKGFADRWGYRELEVANLFAYRATDPRALAKADDPVGPDNDGAIRFTMSQADEIVVAWGRSCPRNLRSRTHVVAALLATSGKPVRCLGTTQDGQPRHPLMLAYETPLIPFALERGGGTAARSVCSPPDRLQGTGPDGRAESRP